MVTKRDIPDSVIRRAKIIVGVISAAAAITVLTLWVLLGAQVTLVVVIGIISVLMIWLGLFLGDRLTRMMRR